MTLISALIVSAFALTADIAPADVKVDDLGFLTGCWAFDRDGKHYDELWLPPAAGAAQGMARTYRADKMLSMEFTKLVRDPDGRVFYVANPSGQGETRFRLVSLERQRAVFEDPAHDFPQRVIYSYTAPDQLNARIEGKLKGKEMSEDYPFRRAACPAPATSTSK